MPRRFIPRGSNAPKKILIMTIINKLVVMAAVSNHGVRKTAARMQPATAKMTLNARLMSISFLKKRAVLESVIDPTASPRMTVEKGKVKPNKQALVDEVNDGRISVVLDNMYIYIILPLETYLVHWPDSQHFHQHQPTWLRIVQ